VRILCYLYLCRLLNNQRFHGIIDLRVEDNGSSEDVDSTSNGLGTSLLSECTMTWSRLASGTGHVLTAALPAGSHPFEAQKLLPLDGLSDAP
jgi:hypothetical protein